MTAKTAFWRWTAIGAITASALLLGQMASVGGFEGLLQVGETSNLRPMIESELGDIPLSPGAGHDGQIYYAIGVDLGGGDVAPLLDHAAYRYRRIAYPLVSSAFGLLDGEALLVGMVVMTVASAAAAAGSVAAIARRQGRSDWWALTVILNPGVWLSIRLLTADTAALALMLLALLGVVAGVRWGAAAFAFSGLAKDVYLITPAGVAIGRDRRRWLLFGISAAVLLAWMAWLTLTLGEGFAARGNLTWPFVGIVQGSQTWSSFDAEEWFYLGFAIASVTAGLIHGLSRRSWLRWPILGWVALALISSNWVWDLGNNAARVFAPIVVLLALAWRDRPNADEQARGAPATTTEPTRPG